MSALFPIWYGVEDIAVIFWTWLKSWLIKWFLFGNQGVSFPAFFIVTEIWQDLLLCAWILLSETEAEEIQTVQQMAEGFEIDLNFDGVKAF